MFKHKTERQTNRQKDRQTFITQKDRQTDVRQKGICFNLFLFGNLLLASEFQPSVEDIVTRETYRSPGWGVWECLA